MAHEMDKMCVYRHEDFISSVSWFKVKTSSHLKTKYHVKNFLNVRSVLIAELLISINFI